MVSGPTASTSPGSAFTDVSPYVAGATVSISIPGNRQNGGGYVSGFSIHFNGFSSENPHKKWDCHL